MRKSILSVVLFILSANCLLCPSKIYAQASLNKIILNEKNQVTAIRSGNSETLLKAPLSLLFFEVNKQPYTIDQPHQSVSTNITFPVEDTIRPYVKMVIRFTNTTADTIELRNVLPLTKQGSDAYITGMGLHPLSRTHLFLPGKIPVNVIVPDNAWDLGYNGFPISTDTRLMMLSRRDRSSIKKGERKRFETILYPGGSVEYNIYAEVYSGNWQQGLNLAFQQRWLYDMGSFNDSLYQRKDLQWMRHSYVMHLMDAWDKFYYDNKDGQYKLQEFLTRGRQLYGGDDIVSVWPTWPTLGLDQRNQFELFQDLPGGLAAMRTQAMLSRQKGARFFICYNPWDESTNSKNHFEGLAGLLSATSADGVVLDTKGESSKELQEMADKVKPGIVMYSEGMAVPHDMPNIVSGRVHNALYYPPMLNLNKLIRPDFSIFRVAELFKEKIKREFATSFFNGYGTEINIMAPGQPAWAEEQYKYLGRTSRILRENTFNFVSRGYTPLIPVTADSIWVNQWDHEAKTIYTIYSTIPAGYKGNLFAIQPGTGYHFVDLWHHKNITPVYKAGKWMVEASTDAFNASDSGTNNEGEVDCIARLSVLLQSNINGNVLTIRAPSAGDELRVWAGAPSYQNKPLLLKPGDHKINISNYFDRYEGDIVIQLMNKGILQDENIVSIPPGTARRISETNATPPATALPTGMVNIPQGQFKFTATNGDEFIAYPKQDQDSVFNMPSYFMDQYPVTNKAFKKFIDATGYHPTDKVNFLKHWINGRIPIGQENFPVIYVSYEDAKAYASWCGKRLPTEVEWQYAAQTAALQEWPWKQLQPVTREEEVVNSTLTVSHLMGIDSTRCNLGDGKLYAVGSYPKGANANGLNDLVGCVWQLTNDLYMSGSHRYIIMKGGSYFKPSSSWWYVQGGPRELHYRQFLLRVSQGFERNATVGFRCVKDKK